ncbi:type 3 dihydrofolate reductase [Aurantivibrio plasticivorans]
MKIALIVAMADQRVIGGGNKLLWHLPEDLKFFKRTTLGKPVIMGRKTYDSIGRPLPERTNIVVTRQGDWDADGVTVVHSVDDALSLVSDLPLIEGREEVMVIGGAQIYKEALPLVQRMYLTRIDAQFDGDAFFPDFNNDEWNEVERLDHRSDSRNPYNYSFITLERKNAL